MSYYDAEKLERFQHVVDTFGGLSKGGWIRRACPACEEMEGKPDYKHSLGYNPSTGGFNCFKCEMKGSLPRNWRDKLELSEPIKSTVKKKQEPTELPEGFMLIFEGTGAALFFFNQARDYILLTGDEYKAKYGYRGGRGIPLAHAVAMGIGAAYKGPLAGRVIVPLFDYTDPHKPWRGWVGRDFTNKSKLPYRYAKAMNRDGLLFNESALWVETDLPVLVVEGVFDTTTIFPDAVATMGKPITSHFPKLLAAKRPVVVCLDGDAWSEGQALAWSLQHMGQKAGNIHLAPKTDPDGYSREWLLDKAREALS